VPPPRVLITTPAHLRVCAEQDERWPEIALVISATAPLSVALAARAERALRTQVMEIFGFTEAGSVASRRTVRDEAWMLYDGMTIRDGRVHVPYLPEAVAFNDRIAVRDARRFVFLGRGEDEANIAGKRVSIAFLDQVLCAIEGVEDGAFFAPDAEDDRPARLAAVAVAAADRRAHIRAALGREIDPVFLPRPLIFVERLPRTALGKLRRVDLLALVRCRAAADGGREAGEGNGST
jgi:acyl-coenzyme A synthetase/AMP-(fatty) acid ligase